MSPHADARALPPSLVPKVPRRLRVIGLLYAISYTLMYVTLWIVSPNERLWGSPVPHVTAGLAVAFSLAVTVLAGRVGARSLSRLVAVHLVVCALGVSIFEFQGELPTEAIPFGVSWIVPLVAMYPLVVPMSPRTVTVAATLAALTVPLGLVVAVLTGAYPWPGVGQLIYLFFPVALAVGAAIWVSRIVHAMGQDLARARALGSYQLVELIGRGGMGEVWRAKHRMLVRPAAIKLIRTESLTRDPASAPVLLSRFKREAEVTARLSSPHIIEVFDFGVTENGAFYYVMELLDGLDLGTLVERHGPQPPARVAHLLEQICDALADAHARGLVHRDIKPANVFACRLGGRHDFVKVLDFGLVKLLEDDEAQTQLTADGVISGTPECMAPETATAQPTQDHRVDIYSLGCVAYTLLTGRPVFEAPSTVAVLLEHVNKPPSSPSERLGAPVPAALEAIVLQCLEKDAADRPQRAVDVLAALRTTRLADGWTPEASRQWWADHAPAGSSPAAASNSGHEPVVAVADTVAASDRAS